jgi:hypothetical protein
MKMRPQPFIYGSRELNTAKFSAAAMELFGRLSVKTDEVIV